MMTRIACCTILTVTVLHGASGQNLFQTLESSHYASYGIVTEGGGDINGDGSPDLLIGIPNLGRGMLLGAIQAVSPIDGEELFFFAGWDFSRLGCPIEMAGDLDGDGRSDVLATVQNPVGVLGISADSQPMFLLQEINEASRFGDSLARLGDLDGDGTPDFAVGAPRDYEDYDEYYNCLGAIYVVSGATRELIHRLKISDDERLRVGPVHAAGDLDQDGIPDVVASASQTGRGRVRIWSGATGEVVRELLDRPISGGDVTVVDDIDLDGCRDLVLYEPTYDVGDTGGRMSVHSGGTLALLYEIHWRLGLGLGVPVSLGDQDGDGRGDFGAMQYDRSEGSASLFSGVDGDLFSQVKDRQPPGFRGPATNLGDLDGDGHDDFSIVDSREAARVLIYSGGRRPRVERCVPPRHHYDEESVVVIEGWHFLKGSEIEVRFADEPALDVVVVNDQTLVCRAPAGAPGPVTVFVSNDRGEGHLPEGFHRTPSLLEPRGDHRRGGWFELVTWAEAGDSHFGIFGIPTDVPLPTPPFGGVLAVRPFWPLFWRSDWPHDELRLDWPIPDDPLLLGVEVGVQGLVGPALGGPDKAGAWTNRQVLEIQ